ncbi:hypothetical protein GCM10023205_60230 [Yinghuangia aomiensis]|uniref:Uncharacterized protein n=1 Tax=Yinghuangia aomiensis TaxID=676205 RepID=A0ABP9HYV4_9ACTN
MPSSAGRGVSAAPRVPVCADHRQPGVRCPGGRYSPTVDDAVVRLQAVGNTETVKTVKRSAAAVGAGETVWGRSTACRRFGRDPRVGRR